VRNSTTPRPSIDIGSRWTNPAALNRNVPGRRRSERYGDSTTRRYPAGADGVAL
jgi:hypothetical protein